MQMLDATSRNLPTRVVRNGGLFSNQSGPTQFTRQPAQAAMFLPGVRKRPSRVRPETTCPQAAQLVVTVPDEFDHMTLTVL